MHIFHAVQNELPSPNELAREITDTIQIQNRHAVIEKDMLRNVYSQTLHFLVGLH